MGSVVGWHRILKFSGDCNLFGIAQYQCEDLSWPPTLTLREAAKKLKVDYFRR